MHTYADVRRKRVMTISIHIYIYIHTHANICRCQEDACDDNPMLLCDMCCSGIHKLCFLHKGKPYALWSQVCVRACVRACTTCVCVCVCVLTQIMLPP